MKIKKTVVTSTTKPSTSSAKGKAASKVNAAQASASTPAGKGKAKTPASPSATPEPSAKSGINRGVKTGMRVMQFQDDSYAQNDDPKRRFTDEELAALWRAEFPNSRAVLAGRITAAMVRSVRNLYNNGTGGHGTKGVTHQSKPYVIENGKRVVAEYTRVRKATEVEPVAPATTGKTSKAAKTVPAVKAAAPAVSKPAASKRVVSKDKRAA